MFFLYLDNIVFNVNLILSIIYRGIWDIVLLILLLEE